MSYCTGLLSLRQDGNGNNVNQLNFSNMSSLQSLNIEGCTGLTEDIDLRDCPNLLTVKAGGTNINVSIPANSGITTYELGIPTEVSIVNPTALTASGISVDGYRNITDLEIIKSNSQTCNAYSMFGKVMENWYGPRIFGYSIKTDGNNIDNAEYGEIVFVDGDARFISPKITAPESKKVNIYYPQGQIVEFGQNDNLIDFWNSGQNLGSDGSRHVTLDQDTVYIRMSTYSDNQTLYPTGYIKDGVTGEILWGFGI